MIYEGLIEEGFAIVKGARDRYDGIPRPPIERNPWNEIECGGHYARAMSSWSLLLALVGLGVRRAAPGAALHAAPHAGELQGLLRRAGRLGQPAPVAGRSGAAERAERSRRTAGRGGDHAGSDRGAQAGEGGMRRQDDSRARSASTQGVVVVSLTAAGSSHRGPDAGRPAGLKVGTRKCKGPSIASAPSVPTSNRERRVASSRGSCVVRTGLFLGSVSIVGVVVLVVDLDLEVTGGGIEREGEDDEDDSNCAAQVGVTLSLS